MKADRLLYALSVLAVLAGCATAPTSPALRSAPMAPLLPVRDFVANTDYNNHYRISPDGRRLAWMAVSGVRESLFVKSLDSGAVTVIPIKGEFLWAQDSRHLLFFKDRKGDENYHVLALDLEAPEQAPRDLTPYERTRAGVLRIIQTDSAHVLIVHNRRDPQVFDLVKVELATGREEVIATNPGDVRHWLTDRDGTLLGRIRQTSSEHLLERLDAKRGEWRAIYRWDRFDHVAPVEITEDRTAVWMLSNKGRDRSALVKLDLQSGRETVVYQHPVSDVGAVWFSQRSRAPLLAYVEPDYPQVAFFDASLKADMAALSPSEPHGIRLRSLDDQDRRMTVEVFTDVGKRFYLYDRQTREKTLLGESASAKFIGVLAPVKPVEFKSRDGLTLRGYLTLPKGVAPKNLPTAVLVHGGPWFRDTWGYDRYTNRLGQFLANRGYAVLQLNYRGSSGYGRQFMEAAIGEFGGKMHDDLIDGVNWLVGQKIADPQRIGIIGRSFGGYATLAGLTFTPDTFACGVSIVGLSDLTTQKGPEYAKLGRYWWERYFGNPEVTADREKLKARSPYFFADAVKRPVLIVYGAHDARVAHGQSEKMVAALKVAGKDVQSIELSEEGHLINRWPSNLKMYRAIEDFFAGCLGGRSAGFDYYQLGAWAF